MKERAIFVTGTDTGVGKTWTSVGLLRFWRGAGHDAVGLKPIECGGRGDATALREAAEGVLSLDEVNPCFLPEPLAPAALTDIPKIDLESLAARAAALRRRHRTLLVEGAGGWLVPLDRIRTLADLAILLGFPVLVVAANRLGCLNHVLLTVRAIAAAGLDCAGVYLNEVESNSPDSSQVHNGRVLRDLLEPVPVFEGPPAEWAERLP